jgi:putative ABC transport system substrate-binding protein
VAIAVGAVNRLSMLAFGPNFEATRMNRRDFIALTGGTFAAWPGLSRAQQALLPVVGFMSTRSPGDSVHLLAAFRRGLEEGGFAEGRNVRVEYRWAGGDYTRMPAFAAELVKLPVTVLVAIGGDRSVEAAKRATSTIPIVFGSGSDPVATGLVASINRPGGNVTGVSVLTNQLEAKRFGLLHELVPQAKLIGVLVNPKLPSTTRQIAEIEGAARGTGVSVAVAKMSNDAEMAEAFASLPAKHPGALLVAADPFFDTRRESIIAFAAQNKLPAMYQFREYAAAGGLVSYGVNLAEGYRYFGMYAAKILKGEAPATLPVQQIDRFELVINLKTAKALGFEFSPTFSARADEVIE